MHTLYSAEGYFCCIQLSTLGSSKDGILPRKQTRGLVCSRLKIISIDTSTMTYAKLFDCFPDIVYIGENRGKDKFRVARCRILNRKQKCTNFCIVPRFDPAESLLSLLTELKQHLLLDDTETHLRLYDQ
ncbi:hypothetical protein VTP01DRAFT_1286 [Rhizomucor pusillus]|uniref:uncharacterized protein n=1 Tax=Rhizomucor pusillus TaxID=4840 RepID=UPI00374439BF